MMNLTRTAMACAALLIAVAAPAAEVNLAPGADVKSLTASLQPGDVYTFEGGTYELPERLVWNGVGTESEPIILRAADGETPVFLLAEGGGNAVVVIDSAAYLTIEGITVTGTDGNYDNNGSAGLIIANSEHITVDSCVSHHTGSTGIYLYGNNIGVQVLHTEVYDTRVGSGIYAGCGDGSCWAQDSVFDNNLIHGIGGDYTDGIRLERGATANVVSNNVVYDVARDGIVIRSTEYQDGNTVIGNVVWNTGDTGIEASGAGYVTNNIVFQTGNQGIYTGNDNGTLADLRITHNTIVMTAGRGVDLDSWAGTSGMVFANNIIANPVGVAFYTDAVDVDDSVRFIGNAFTGFVQGLGEFVESNPDAFFPAGGYYDFVDAENWDFYPMRASSIVNTADPASESWVPGADFNDEARSGEAPDVGAYEWTNDDNPGWAIAEEFKVVGADNGAAGTEVGGCCGKSGEDAEVEDAALLPLLGLGLLFRRRRRSS